MSTASAPAPSGWRELGTASDPADPRIRRAVVAGVAWIVGGAGLLWAAMYLAIGLPGASAYPLAFSILTVVNAVAQRIHGHFRIFAAIQLGLVAVVPVALMLHLGGFGSSGAVGLWALLAPLGALLVIGSEAAIGSFVVFALLMGFGTWADSNWSAVEALPSDTERTFLFLNIVAVSFAAFWVTRTFLVANGRLAEEQRRLRAVEHEYVRQEAMLRQQERLVTLGRLSAGVAHELNNPAAAAGRASSDLREVVDRLIEDGVELLRHGLGPDGVSWVGGMADERLIGDVVERSDREDRLARWLELSGEQDPWDLASALADLGFDTRALDGASERYSRRKLVAALRWLSDVARARTLIGEVRSASTRISETVAALKGYSHMDQAGESVFDLRSGLEDTLVILKSKLAGIDVRLSFEELRPIVGQPGQLNQVWTNLIANAAEALEGRGTITVSAWVVGDRVRVEIIDDGPGIPEEIIGSVFDPFVTTKAPGEGTGLGLNLTHQIVVDRHGGDISVTSSPAGTRFVVDLPVASGITDD